MIDLRPSTKSPLKHRASVDNKLRHIATAKPNAPDLHRPTGLVTSMGGTVVKDGVTTVHETSVLGTYISGKYAQILQSTSHIFQNHKKLKPTPTSNNKILKTAAPSLPKSSPKPNLEPTPVGTLQEDSALPLEALFSSPSGGNLIRQSRRPAVGSSPFKNRFNRNRGKGETKEQELDQDEPEEVVVTPSSTSSYKKHSSRNRNSGQSQRPSFK